MNMYQQWFQINARVEQERRRRTALKLSEAERAEKFRCTEDERTNLLSFVKYTMPEYIVNWHHEKICSMLDGFASGKISRLMVFMPPQHGKSELVSRRLPAYMLGRDPDLRYIGASYSEELACSFNRDTQRIVDDTPYSEIFEFSNKSVPNRRYLKRADMFEIEGYRGYYKSVGIGGSLTGFSADVLSIDDPVKGPEQAFSEAYRRSVWEWYTSVVETRLHNKSRLLLTMTRWHEDDLAGRLLQIEPDKWEVISFPAIKESDGDEQDPRQTGEALWPGMHSLDTLESIRRKSERTFISLYQQRPAPEEGNIIKKQWFKYFFLDELPAGSTVDFYTDTAYGKENSDNSATICYTICNGSIYVRDVWTANLNYPEFKRTYVDYVSTHGYSHASECVFEPKATGISIVQDLQETVLADGMKLNVIEDSPPKDDKLTRVMASSPAIESGRVYLLKGGAWCDKFLEECAAFPNGKYDDQIDALSGVIMRRFKHDTEPKIRCIVD